MTTQQFKQMPYQAVAAEAVVDCFEGQPKIDGISYQIDPGRDPRAQVAMFDEGLRNAGLRLDDMALLANIKKVQMRAHLPPSASLVQTRAAPINLDVEMETGTGKTYVYIDTMYRLYERYGWSKFIVIVPSVAIREGVAKTFDDTEAHFHARYGHKVRRFIYDSSRPEPIMAFADSPGLHCMIINTQAFTAEVNAAYSDSKTRRMFREMDQFGSRRPIDLISANRPILILDEPQRMEGPATARAMEHFKAPIALRYSATHKTSHNLVHRLDALDAYNRKLVKKISVRGVTVTGRKGLDGYLYLTGFRPGTVTRPVQARIEMEYGIKSGAIKRKAVWVSRGDDLEDKSGGLAQYSGYTVEQIDAQQGFVDFTGQERLWEGRITGDSSETAVRRVQIRETIRAHFERERLLHRRGIKVLSLFFIDAVSKYRVYTDDGQQPGDYATIFEEEYQAALDELGAIDATDEMWFAYVRRDRPDQVHDGYFSIDKKGRMVDPSVNKTGDEKGEAKDASSYDLILRDKGRLLSLDEPVRFIFSHSALREGWDNPNVFTICTLKHSDHEIGKRQEVGRGLRISVDDKGYRTDGPEVHDINVLTVIASESYEDFANGLQDEMAKALEGRPREANAAYFQKLSIETKTGIEPVSQASAGELEYWLIGERYIDPARHITPKWHADREAIALAVSAGAEDRLDDVSDEVRRIWEGFPTALRDNATEYVALVDTVFDESALRKIVRNDRGTVMPMVRQKNLEREEFQELWRRISRKAVYFSDFDSERLIKAAIARLDADLRVERQRVVVQTGHLRTDADVHDVRSGSAFREERATYEHREEAVDTSVRYDLVGRLAFLTRLTRSTASGILQGINASTFAMFGQNPEMFLRKAAELILAEKIRLAVESIRYEPTGESYAVTIFETDRHEIPIADALAASDHIYDYVAVDSDNERRFAERLEAADEIIVYAKLPRGFTIPTPGGTYNPDWALAVQSSGTRQIYFVAETKGGMMREQLRMFEDQNIESAKRYFADVAADVTFRKVSDYATLKQELDLIGVS